MEGVAKGKEVSDTDNGKRDRVARMNNHSTKEKKKS